MRQYQNGEDHKLICVVCNGCGKQLRIEDGYLKEGCFHGERLFGYFSNKDGIRHSFDLCEECYEKWTGSFAIPVEEEEEKELL